MELLEMKHNKKSNHLQQHLTSNRSIENQFRLKIKDESTFNSNLQNTDMNQHEKIIKIYQEYVTG
jgi:hypothetical protein